MTKATYEIDLLKLEDGDNSHYVYITGYSRLMSSQNNKKRKLQTIFVGIVLMASVQNNCSINIKKRFAWLLKDNKSRCQS